MNICKISDGLEYSIYIKDSQRHPGFLFSVMKDPHHLPDIRHVLGLAQLWKPPHQLCSLLPLSMLPPFVLLRRISLPQCPPPTFHHEILSAHPQALTPLPRLSWSVFLKCHHRQLLLSQFFPSRQPCKGLGAYSWSWFILHVAEPEVSPCLRTLPISALFSKEKKIFNMFVHLVICLIATIASVRTCVFLGLLLMYLWSDCHYPSSTPGLSLDSSPLSPFVSWILSSWLCLAIEKASKAVVFNFSNAATL